MSNKLHSNKPHNDKLHNELHNNELHGNKPTSNKTTKPIKGLFTKLKEAFRSNTKGIADTLLDAIHNPTPRSELFPYRFYNEEIYYIDENIGGFIFECDPLVGISDDLYKQISMLFDDQLPFGGVIEVLLLASDDLSPIISKWEKAGIQKEKIFTKLKNYRKEFFKSYNNREDTNCKHRNYKLFISYSNDLSKKKRVNSANPKTNTNNISTQDNISTDKIKSFKKRLSAILQGIGINPQTVTPVTFLSLIKELINYPNFTDTTYREEESLSDQICDVSNALLVSDDGIINSTTTNNNITENNATPNTTATNNTTPSNPHTNNTPTSPKSQYTTRAYEVTTYPKEFAISKIPALLGDLDSDSLQIPSRFAILYTVSNEITNTEQETYKKKGELAVKQANSRLDIINRSIKEEGKEWNEIIESNLKLKEKFLRTTFLVMITTKTNNIEHAEQSLMSLWRKNDLIINPLKYFQLPALLSFCPFLNKTKLGNLLRRFSIKRTVLSSEPKALLPIHSEWKGVETGGLILTGRRGQLFTWNNFEGGSNYNTCVIGESGSGKSVFLQELVMSHLAQGTRVFVVDIGRSFEKTCKLMKGDFLSFGVSSKISLNPFSNIPDIESYNPNKEEEDNTNLAQDSLNSLKKIIAKMVAPIAGTTDMQNALIAQNLAKLWQTHKSSSNIDKLVEILNKEGKEDNRAKDLATMLFEFTSKGNYGQFFNKTSTVKFNKQLTVLEFDELRENPELGAVIMQMLAIQIVQQVYLGDRRQRFIILFDEAWYALENFPLFLVSMARTVRKYNGALILGTQSLKNFYGSSGKDTLQAAMDTARMGVIENSAWRVLLRQSGESSDSLEKMKIPEHLINIVKGLTTSVGNYSEMLIYQSDKNYFVSRLMLDQFSQTLYSSSPSVFARVKSYMDQNMDTGEAVERVMKEGDK